MDIDYPDELTQLKSQITEILKLPIVGKSVEIKFMPSVRIDWRWTSDSCGELIVDCISPKSINISDLSYIGKLCMSSILRYRTFVMIGQKEGVIRLTRVGLSGELKLIMDELEEMLNIWDGFEAMLIEGSFGRRWV